MDTSIVLLLFAPLVLAGLGMVLYGIRGRQKAQAAMQWLTTEGKGLSVKIARRVSRSKYSSSVYYVPQLEYEYAVRGQHYSSHRITFGTPSFKSESDCKSYLENHFEGKPLTVHYDPKQPKNAVLLPGEAPNTMGFIIGGAMIFLFSLVVGGYLMMPR